MPGFTLRMAADARLPRAWRCWRAAQADPEQQRAKAMLENLCGRCHAVGRAGKSPNPLAPAFRSFGEKLYDTDMVQRLQDGLTTVHKDMPDLPLRPARGRRRGELPPVHSEAQVS